MSRIQISLQQNVMNVDTVSQHSVSLDDIHSVVYHCCHTQLLLECLKLTVKHICGYHTTGHLYSW